MKRIIAFAVALALTVPAVAVQPPGNVKKGNDTRLDELEARIEQVNAEDMRVKRGEVNDGTLTLRVEDMAKSQGRPFIYGTDVDIDVSSLEESAEIAAERDARIEGDYQSHLHTESVAATLREADGLIRSEFRGADQQLSGRINDLSGTVGEIGGLAGSNADRITAVEGDVLGLQGRTTALQQQIRSVEEALDLQREEIRGGLAGVAALGLVQQNPSADGIQLSIGAATYGRRSAGAVVVGGKLSERVYINAGTTYGAGSAQAWGMSTTFRIGGK